MACVGVATLVLLIGAVIYGSYRLDKLSDTFSQEIKNMAGELAALEVQVSETNGVIASAVVLIRGFKAALDEAIASGNPAKLVELSNSLDSSERELSAAVAENPLPGEPPPV